MTSVAAGGVLAAVLMILVAATSGPAQDGKAASYDPTKVALAEIAGLKVAKGDWPQWAGWSGRNNTPSGTNIPIRWDVKTGENVKWSARLGSQTYGNPVVANGKVYVGTNNGAGLIKRYPPTVDLGCMLCFDASNGKLLWEFQTGAGANAPSSIFEYQGDQYVVAYSAGNAFGRSVKGDSVWLFSLNGTLSEASPAGSEPPLQEVEH